MKKLIYIYLGSVLFTVGCCPTRHIGTSTQDSVRVETVVRYERVPDTVFIEVPVEVVRQTARDTTSHLETSFAVSDARITPDGSLSHSLANKPQKRPVPTEKEVIYRDSIIYQDRITTDVVEVPAQLTKWQQMQINGFWKVSAILAILITIEVFQVLKRIRQNNI